LYLSRAGLKQTYEVKNDAMKILLVITRSELGGAQTVVVQLANKLCEHHQVILAAGEGDGKMWDMVSSPVIKEKCPHLQRAISSINDFYAILELRKIYNRHNPDVIHLHSSKAGTLGRLIFPTKKIVYTVHGFDSVRIAFRKFLPIERLLQYFCNAIVGVSEYDKIHLIEERITHNVYTVHNGIAIPDTSRLQNIDALKQKKKTILSIARVFPQKKTDLFIKVARMLPEYNFVWIGNQHEVTEYGELPENCHFVGNIPNAGAYCSQADLFMLPSNYEGLPMVIIEAMSLGKPIIASDVDGISEIVKNGENGYVLENKAEVFAEKIRLVLEDDETYRKFCKKSHEYYESKLTVEKMVAEYMKIYDRICRS